MNTIETQLSKLIEIADYLHKEKESAELKHLQARLSDQSTPLLLPLVGEFSAGKTSLLNALTDSKQLEVATRPTTATIYEIHFGQEKCYASVLQPDGTEQIVENIGSLENSQLGDVPLINIYDTSNRVPRDLVLVDTPGLSSPDPKHRDVLVSFLPKVDAILMAVDCNQQITRSLLDFIEECNLVGRKIYLVITKCDTKSPSEIEKVKQYISENSKLPLEQMVTVAANEGNMAEFYSLIERLKKDKHEILLSSIYARIHTLKGLLTLSVEELLQLPDSTEALEAKLREVKGALSQIEKEIDRLMSSISIGLDDVSEDTSSKYKKMLFQRFDSLLASSDKNLTNQANSILQSVNSVLTTQYRNDIAQVLNREVAKSSLFIRTAVARLNLSELGVSTSLIMEDLDQIGHEWDNGIATAVATAATVAVIASTGGVGAIGGAGTLVSVADTASDVASMVSNAKTVERMENVIKKGAVVINGYNQRENLLPPKSESIVRNTIGKLTERFAKPKRQRFVNELIEQQLLPEFELQMKQNIDLLLSTIRTEISEESKALISEQAEQIAEIKTMIGKESEAYLTQLKTLKEYRRILNN